LGLGWRLAGKGLPTRFVEQSLIFELVVPSLRTAVARAAHSSKNEHMTGLTIISVLLAIICVGSSVADLKKLQPIVDSLNRLDVPLQLRPLLPVFKTLGAAGILLGLKAKGLGVAAAFGLVLYFVGAVVFHMRAKESPKESIPAFVILILALVTFALRLSVKN
jgi:predicted membrane channel-forming protein YqfA (hemolysin III family)